MKIFISLNSTSFYLELAGFNKHQFTDVTESSEKRH